MRLLNGTIKKLHEKTNNTREKWSPPSDDDDVIVNSTESDGGQHEGKNIQHIQHQSTPTNDKNNDVQFGQSNISNQAIAYAVENNLQAIKIECTPPLENRDLTKKFVISFFNFINKDFRKEYPGNTQPLAFHHWWTDSGGNKFYGVINDTDLYIYWCDLNHYPTQINNNVKLKPEPPKRLPPQNTIVIKFVPNELHNFEVEEYLPPPKILICSKCNTSGHAKKACQSSVEICRRCGENRSNGNKHIECSLIDHYCGGNHMANRLQMSDDS